ncbi:MAG: hypothetical protein UHN02_01050 [Acutalibacteraceae bacterium]|nr:hypothetical protein [Acutalibacteraceae bacterium]
MEKLANLFELDNVVLSYIIGIIVILLSVFISFICIKSKENNVKSGLVLSIISLVMCAVSNFCAYHYIITIGCITSIVALAFSLAKLNLAVNKNKNFQVNLYSLFVRNLMPLSITALLFGPLFIDISFYGESATFYKIWTLFGMKTVGVYAFSFDTFNIIALLELCLLAALVGVQLYTLIQLFINPDYCDSWSLFHLIITVIGVLFVYGIYTSDNFLIFETMPSVSNNLTQTFTIYFIIILAVINKVVYFKRVDKLLNKNAA